jgi:MFS family permease
MLPVATLAIIATSPAQTFGISAFNASLRTSLGLSHSQLTGAYMLGTLLASLPLSWVGALMDRFGIRRTMSVVVLLFGGVCIATSQVSGLVTLFIAFLLLRMLGQGALGLLSGNTLPFWFQRRLGTVEGVRHFGMAGAIAAVPAISLALIGAFGWRMAWVLLGLAVWAMMLPAMLLFRNRPEDVGQWIDGGANTRAELEASDKQQMTSFTFGQARRTRAFWVVVAMTAFWGMANTAVIFNIVPLFESRGLTEQHAAILFTGFAVSLALMQLFGGMLADHFPLNRLLSVAAVGMAMSMFGFWWIDSPAWITPLSMAMGLSQGLLTAAAGPLWPRYYGTAHLGRIRGALATVMVSASSVGPFILGLSVDWLGDYRPALLVFVVVALPFAGVAIFATPPGRSHAEGSGTEPHATPADEPPEAIL